MNRGSIEGQGSGKKRRHSCSRDMDIAVDEAAVEVEVRSLVDKIRGASQEPVELIDRTLLRKVTHQLADLCKSDDHIERIVECGAVDAVVPLLTLGDSATEEAQGAVSFEDIKKEACFVLGLLAVKPDYQVLITRAAAIPGLVKLLRAHRPTTVTRSQPGSGGVARRAADAITNLAHENMDIKNRVRQDGGIPPLVALLEAWDIKVQRAAAGALRTLAFKNEDNKNQIVECGALPMLIQMLRAEDPGVHYEAVGVIGNLVHSSQNIKRRVLEEGALQPVINLLSSSCPESQREAALLLGQFATTQVQPGEEGPDYKTRIVQRGAVPPLIDMLSAADIAIKEMAAFALGRLAQNSHNQAGIAQCGGLPPLLELLESKHYNLQHNAAFALYGLSDNDDNIPGIIQEGGLQRLLDCVERLQVQASKDCVHKTITRIQGKLAAPRTLNHVVYMLRSGVRAVKQSTALALAHLAPDAQLNRIFVGLRGLEVLLDLLVDADTEPALCKEAARAVKLLAEKVSANAPLDDVHNPQQPQRTVYLGAEYVNNKTLADVTFLVEGQPFYAHRIALLASSEAFRAMFNQNFRERDASSIEIPNIRYDVFQVMMQYIYTGSVAVEAELARDLLQASDMYLLEGLKRLCEAAMAQSLTVDNLMEVFALSEAFSAPSLAKRCVLFALDKYEELCEAGGGAGIYPQVMARMLPVLKSSLVEDLCKERPVPMDTDAAEPAAAAAPPGAPAPPGEALLGLAGGVPPPGMVLPPGQPGVPRRGLQPLPLGLLRPPPPPEAGPR